MIEQIKQALLREYGETPSFAQVHQFIDSLVYRCAMFWQHRTDKLHKADYPLYLWLTNNMTGIAESSKLNDSFEPCYGNNALFNMQYSHTELKATLVEKLTEALVPEPKNTTSKWRQFIQLFAK